MPTRKALLLFALSACTAAPLSGQTSDGTPGVGFSIGAFFFNSGVGPGVVLDRPLTWNEERGAAIETWVSLVPENGIGAALGVRLGSGALRGGVGLAALKASGDFFVGPGFQVGLGVPIATDDSAARLEGSFHAYFTNLGYVPMLRLTLGPWRIISGSKASAPPR